ncbi:hypothetical protein [Phytoactinopolyspora mesophila]|uniref:Uncharacterized protein n=1 Tax=Phytoactinopolyspora mesophila TaxID=2650750 RepID=A0A7K3M457_9ACTN|nr:hypothetical protein [Phytoactinopolyspora mesophila]NDL58026.1 hypothetical protein [Phytoactinopolyspora mesophila]
MTNNYQRTALSFCAATFLLMTGCSKTDTADGPDADHDTSGPLAEFMSHTPVTSGFGRHGFRADDDVPEHSEEEFRQHRHVEESVAECMRDAGFEYVPTTLENDDTGPNEFDEAYSLEPAEFAEQFGYGLTTIIFTSTANEPREPDPNEEIQENLGGAAREAHDDALWGKQDEDSGLRENSGCYDQAYADMVDDQPNLDEISSEFDALFNDVDALFDRVDRDPRVSAMVDEWRECMAGQGFSGFEELDQPYWSIQDRASEVSVPEAEAASTSGDVGVIVEGDTRFVIAPQVLAELQKHEIELATADLQCRAQHEAAYHEVAMELEEEFVDAQRAELERYREFLHGSGAS